MDDLKAIAEDTKRVIKMGKNELEYKYKLLIGMANVLPNFDASWPQEKQQTWHEAHQALLMAGLRLAETEDEIAPDEHELLDAFRAGQLEKVLRITLRRIDDNKLMGKNGLNQ